MFKFVLFQNISDSTNLTEVEKLNAIKTKLLNNIRPEVQNI